MTARRLLILALLTAATLIGAGADRASACSCADSDPRDRVEAGEPALIGRVVEATRNPADPYALARYVVRVERALNVRLGRRVTLRSSPFSSSCGVEWNEGRRIATFLYRARGRWMTGLCNVVAPHELERASRPYTLPLGRGQVALLAGGSFGDARLMALDRRGRVLGYGFGQGAVRRISVCPGARLAAELVDRGRRLASVVVRSLESLAVVSAAEVPRHMTELSCADATGGTVYAAGIKYSGRPVRGSADVYRVDGSTRTRLARRPAEHLALGTDVAYLWSSRRLRAIGLRDGSERTVLRMGLPERIAPNPFGGPLAVQDYRNRLRLVDPATGAVIESRRSPGGELVWLAADRLFSRVGGAAVILDSRLRRQRRYGFYRAFGQAHLDGLIFGTDRYRLVSLNLENGRKRTVARLPDRGIAALVGVPDGPELNAPPRAPRVLRPAAGRTLVAWATSSSPPTSVSTSPGASACSRPRTGTPTPRTPSAHTAPSPRRGRPPSWP